MSKYAPTPHPILRLPTARQAAALGEEKWRETLKRRENIIELEANDPLRHGWEPPVWKIADALLGWPWVDSDWAARFRRALGFVQRVKCLFILGGNRSSKTEYAAKRTSQLMQYKPGAQVWPFHSTAQMSVDSHHKLMHKFLPPEQRHFQRTAVSYVSYKQKTGFSDQAFVLPNTSECKFKNYSQEKDDALQGPENDVSWPDELVPPDWVEDLMMRIATRDGRMMVTFTPVRGYTATVKMVQDGAESVLDQTAFLCPRDEGDPDEARALGFADEETRVRCWTEYAHALGYQSLEAMLEKVVVGPWAVPTDFSLGAQQEEAGSGRLFSEAQNQGQTPAGQEGEGEGEGREEGSFEQKETKENEGGGDVVNVREPAVPEGRRFERMPRVMKCIDPNYAILFFYPTDNPFGNPKAVLDKVRGKSRPYIKERWYGWANKTISCRFPKFSPRIHVIDDAKVPPTGVNIMLADPAGARNFFMKWYRLVKDTVYLYREWPGSYEIPGIGVPGRWALPDGKKLDGRPGPGQASFGWGLLRYKQEIARLEGWKDAISGRSREQREEEKRREEGDLNRRERRRTKEEERGAEQQLGIGQRFRTLGERDVRKWDPANGCRERILERFLDSRAASTERIENDRPRTLQTDFQDIGLDFLLTPGEAINEGAELVNDALDYDEDIELSFFNMPHFFVARSCQNSIFALQTWTGADGQKGACKDPVDLDRYLFLLDLEGIDEEKLWETSGGGYY